MVDVPADKTLTLTVPKMERIQDVTLPNAIANEIEDMLDQYSAVRLKGTGFPWEAEANVFILGQRFGDESSPSYRAFRDIGKLEEGDEIYVTDANGHEYTYQVFQILEVLPTDLFVTEPIPGKNILTLQACTRPDCSNWVIVQSKLDYSESPGAGNPNPESEGSGTAIMRLFENEAPYGRSKGHLSRSKKDDGAPLDLYGWAVETECEVTKVESNYVVLLNRAAPTYFYCVHGPQQVPVPQSVTGNGDMPRVCHEKDPALYEKNRTKDTGIYCVAYFDPADL
jgi:LPXTG-site transpeptidase (sortase) family protein